jgi:3-oxoacyl-[acyl-carrier protein] reductase
MSNSNTIIFKWKRYNLHKAPLTPLERLAISEDISDTVTYLSTSGRWINGQVIFLNGGLT